MAQILIKRGTRANLDTAAGASGLTLGEPYLVTDENRVAVGTGVSTYRAVLMDQEALISQPEHNIGNLGASATIDPANGNRQRAVVNASATVTLTAPAAATAHILLHLTVDATGGYSITWPGGLQWVTGTAPDFDMTANAENIVVLIYANGGWIGDGGAL